MSVEEENQWNYKTVLMWCCHVGILFNSSNPIITTAGGDGGGDWGQHEQTICARWCVSRQPYNNLLRMVHYYRAHFTAEETGTEGDLVTCPELLT